MQAGRSEGSSSFFTFLPGKLRKSAREGCENDFTNIRETIPSVSRLTLLLTVKGRLLAARSKTESASVCRPCSATAYDRSRDRRFFPSAEFIEKPPLSADSPFPNVCGICLFRIRAGRSDRDKKARPGPGPAGVRINRINVFAYSAYRAAAAPAHSRRSPLPRRPSARRPDRRAPQGRP